MLPEQTLTEIRMGACQPSGPIRNRTAAMRQGNLALACDNRTKFSNIEWIELLQ